MPDQKTKCIIILSAKSSGSSALQNLLTAQSKAAHISKTRHYQNETLFWVKAASVLGLPQVDMPDSEVPIPPDKARADLIELLTDNLGPSYVLPENDRQLVFDGWRQLCQCYAPVFLEKSPHHLHQWSALQLIVEGIEELPEIEFLLVGLLRNPMDTLYSMWRRWKTIPEQNQYALHTAYSNLEKLKELVGERLVIVRYEDMVQDHDSLKEIYQFLGVTNDESGYLHNKSLRKWKQDKLYGFQLSPQVAALARQHGYSEHDLTNDVYALWPHYCRLARWRYRSVRLVKSALRSLKKS